MFEFRPVYFRPNLIMDWKIPVLAVVKAQNVLAEVLPGKCCLGSKASHSLLENTLKALSRADSHTWEELPSWCGPHFELGRSGRARNLEQVKRFLPHKSS